MPYLKQSTSTTIKLGQFVATSDGVTPVTALASTALIKISKDGGAFAKRSGTAVTHDTDGWFDVTLNATDTDTLGRLVVQASGPGTFAGVWEADMDVVPANVYDSLVGGSDNLEVDSVAIGGDTAAADNVRIAFDSSTTTALIRADLGGKVTETTKANIQSVRGDTAAAANISIAFDSATTTTLIRADLSGDVLGNVQGTSAVNVTEINGDTAAAANLSIAFDSSTTTTLIRADLSGDVRGDVQGTSAVNVTQIDGNTAAAANIRIAFDSATTTTLIRADISGDVLGNVQGTSAVNVTQVDGDTAAAANIRIAFDSSTTTSLIRADLAGKITETTKANIQSVRGDTAAAANIGIAFDSATTTTLIRADLSGDVLGNVQGTSAVNVTQIDGDTAAAANLAIAFDSSTTTTLIRADLSGQGGSIAGDTFTSLRLDHLLATAAGTADVANDSVIAQLATKTGTWTEFVQNTDSLEKIGDQVAFITSGTELVSNQLLASGSTIILYQGESRGTASGNSIQQDVSSSTIDLTGYTPKLGLTKIVSASGDTALKVDGTVSDPGGASQKVIFELTTAQTSGLAVLDTSGTGLKAAGNEYRYTISASDGTHCPVISSGEVDTRNKDSDC